MELVLLRHGETEWNLTGRMQGVSDTRLTEAGLAQAHQALPALPRFSQVWTSPLRRARDTAEVVAAAQGLPCTQDARLIERSWGDWEGLLPDEVDRDWPGWRASGRMPAGYEPDDAVYGRFREWSAEVAAHAPGGLLLVVTHGGFMGALVRVLGGESSGYRNLEGVWLSDSDGGFSVLRHQEFVPGARRLTR